MLTYFLLIITLVYYCNGFCIVHPVTNETFPIQMYDRGKQISAIGINSNPEYPKGGSVIFTGDIPQCPYCKKPTKRTEYGWSFRTLMYFPPTYDEHGVNVNPDRNIRTSGYQCLECGHVYYIKGNDPDGYRYALS